VVGGCYLEAGAKNWVFNSSSKCAIAAGDFGSHGGSGVGGECILFGLGSGIPPLKIYTPYGELTADVVANSGNTYCVKPLPPTTVCDISLPSDGIIDHGTMEPNSIDVRKIYADVDCGVNPQMTTLLGNDVTLGPGVSTKLSFDPVKRGVYAVTSTMKTTNATPDSYQATAIIAVSPP
jgi:hypothetical protein